MHACETPLKRKIFSVRRHLQNRDLPSTYLSSMFEDSNVNPRSISMKTKYQKEAIVSLGILPMGKDNITETNFCNKFPIKIADECLGKHIFAAAFWKIVTSCGFSHSALYLFLSQRSAMVKPCTDRTKER